MPATTVDNLFYEDIAKELEAKNPATLHKYFYAQKYIPPDDKTPFGSILPLTDLFFGPKNLTLLILSKPYRIAPDLLPLAIEMIKRHYVEWSDYKVMIWIDMVLALRMVDEGDNDYYSKMESFAEQVKGFCTQLKNFGVEYKGMLMEGKDAKFFQTYINEFNKAT